MLVGMPCNACSNQKSFGAKADGARLCGLGNDWRMPLNKLWMGVFRSVDLSMEWRLQQFAHQALLQKWNQW